MKRPLVALATVIALATLTACSNDNAALTTQQTLQSATSSIAATTPPTQYDQWAIAIRQYGHQPSQSAFQYHQEICSILRTGVKPAGGPWPERSAPEYLRDEFYVGKPDATANEERSAHLAEHAIVGVLCPDQAQDIFDAKAGNFTAQLRTAFSNGRFIVGQDISPGTYTVANQVTDCYWERSDAQGNIIDNNLISIAPSVTVTIAPTDTGFTSERCGSWQLQP